MKNIMIYSRVRFPVMRKTLIGSLYKLSDKKMQLEKWINPSKSCFFWSTLLFDLEFLYDDIVLYEHPEDAIGYVTLNEEENAIMLPLYKALDDICEQIGEKQPDSAYINSPLWDKVIESAQAALEVFLKNEEETKKLNPHPWNGEEDWGDDPGPDSAPAA
jgi:hypothetical protein